MPRAAAAPTVLVRLTLVARLFGYGRIGRQGPSEQVLDLLRRRLQGGIVGRQVGRGVPDGWVVTRSADHLHRLWGGSFLGDGRHPLVVAEQHHLVVYVVDIGG